MTGRWGDAALIVAAVVVVWSGLYALVHLWVWGAWPTW